MLSLETWRNSVAPLPVEDLKRFTASKTEKAFREAFGNSFLLSRHDPETMPAPAGFLTVAGPIRHPETVATNRGWVHIVCHTPRSAFDSFVSIGRTRNNDIVIEHPNVSRFHALIVERDKMPWLWDAGSRNGSFVDGVRAQKRGSGEPLRLQSCALVRIGTIELTFFDASGLLAALQ